MNEMNCAYTTVKDWQRHRMTRLTELNLEVKCPNIVRRGLVAQLTIHRASAWVALIRGSRIFGPLQFFNIL